MAEAEAFDQFVINVGRDTWEIFRREAVLFVIASVVLSIVSVVSLGLIAGPATVGFIDMVRRSRAGEPLSISMLFSRFDTFVASLVAMIIIGIAVCIGMMLLVVPGLLAMLFACFTFHAIAYESLSGVAALQRSFELVKGYFLQTIALLFVISVAHAIGGAVVFGVLLTAPLSLIALTVGFERLTGASAPDVLTV
jgi:hypothetical protein